MLGFQEAAEVKWVQSHHHGDVVHTAQREERLDEDVLVQPSNQNLESERKMAAFNDNAITRRPVRVIEAATEWRNALSFFVADGSISTVSVDAATIQRSQS